MNRRDMLSSMVSLAAASPIAAGAPGPRRIRELGVDLGPLPTGAYNAITDVPGVEVGHTTLLSGDPPLVIGKGPVRTGVTVILPRGRTDLRPCRAGAAVLNGNGEMTGVLSIRRTGTLSTPICLTGTANVGIVHRAVLELMLERGSSTLPSPVVAECWDAIGDVEGRHLRDHHVREAVASAKSGPVAEGAVGGGTGMTCYGFKGGIGTSSRIVEGMAVGALVNANHGLREQLLIAGLPVGRALRDYPVQARRPSSSIVLVAATDAPLDARQLERLALRMSLGLARTGATANTSSGDLLLAFSTSMLGERVLEDERLSPLYEAVVEAAAEAVLNALSMAVDVVGADGRVVPALPLDRVAAIVQRADRARPSKRPSRKGG